MLQLTFVHDFLGRSPSTLLEGKVLSHVQHSIEFRDVVHTRLSVLFIKQLIPSQQEEIHAHSFVLEPELRIQYTYTQVKKSERHRF